MESYMGEEIGAFEFDDRLFELYGSKDDTVRSIAFDLWNFYDDGKEHKITATKGEWDYFNRITILNGLRTIVYYFF